MAQTVGFNELGRLPCMVNRTGIMDGRVSILLVVDNNTGSREAGREPAGGKIRDGNAEYPFEFAYSEFGGVGGQIQLLAEMRNEVGRFSRRSKKHEALHGK